MAWALLTDFSNYVGTFGWKLSHCWVHLRSNYMGSRLKETTKSHIINYNLMHLTNFTLNLQTQPFKHQTQEASLFDRNKTSIYYQLRFSSQPKKSFILNVQHILKSSSKHTNPNSYTPNFNIFRISLFSNQFISLIKLDPLKF